MDTPMHLTSTPGTRRGPRWLRPGLIWFLLDLLVPTAIFYAMVDLGSGLYLALLVSAGLSTVSAIVSYRRGAGGQSFAPYMLVLQLAAFGIAFISGSDRFLLAKESLLTAAVGFWFIGSIWAARPLAYVFTKPLLEGAWGRRWGLTGTPWEVLWEREPHFRRIWRVSSIMWGIATLVDAVLRVVLAYTLPIEAIPLMQTAMFAVTLLLMQVVTHVWYARAGLWPMLAGYERRGSESPT